MNDLIPVALVCKRTKLKPKDIRAFRELGAACPFIWQRDPKTNRIMYRAKNIAKLLEGMRNLAMQRMQHSQ